MDIQIQKLGEVLSLDENTSAREVRVLEPTLKNLADVVDDFEEARSAAEKLKQIEQPKVVAEGANELKILLKQDQTLQMAVAAATVIDPHWIDRPLLRAAGASDQILEGIRVYFKGRPLLTVGDLASYSIEGVRQAIHATEETGILQTVLNGPRFQRPENIPSTEMIIKELREFIGKAPAMTKEARREKYESIEAQIVDHPFGEYHIGSITVAFETKEDFREGLPMYQSAISKTGKRYVLYPIFGKQNDPSVVEQYGQFTKTNDEVQRSAQARVDRLPPDDPVKIYRDLVLQANELVSGD